MLLEKFDFVPGQATSSLSDPGHVFPPFNGVGFVQVLLLCCFPFLLQDPTDFHLVHPPSTEIGNQYNDILFGIFFYMDKLFHHCQILDIPFLHLMVLGLCRFWPFFSFHWCYKIQRIPIDSILRSLE